MPSNFSKHIPRKTNKQAFYDPCALGTFVHSDERKDVMMLNRHLDGINPVSCGQHSCMPDHIYGPKFREYYLLHYIISGKGTFTSHKKTHSLKQGDIFVIRPYEITEYHADTEQPWTYRWIGFQSSIDISSILTEDMYTVPECDYLFRLLLDSSRIDVLKEFYMCAKIYELLSLLGQKSLPKTKKNNEYIPFAKNFIEIHYSDPNLSISSLAETLNLDRSYFSTIFKKQLGESPMQYLVNFRLNKAAEMLYFNQTKPSEVARACGYADVFTFSKMFKKKFHICPSKYGKEHR